MAASSASSAEFNFSAALLEHHLGLAEEARVEADSGGEDQTDGGPSARVVFDAVHNLDVTEKGLKMALHGFYKSRNRVGNIDDLYPADDRHKHGDVAVLHRLVIREYTNQSQLVVALRTFSDADIDQKTSHGKTAFHLAVELGNIKVMKTLVALEASVHLPPIDTMPYLRPFLLQTTAGQPANSSTSHTERDYMMYLPTYAESEASGWSTGYFGGSTIGYGATSLRPDTSSSQTNAECMITLLREIGAVSKDKNSRTCHSKKQKSRQADMQSASPNLRNPCSSESGFTPGQSVEKKLDESVDDQGRGGVRVLCLDGGGVRGLVQLQILRELEERLAMRNETITSFFDYIVGTSTGGIITLALVYGGKPVREIQRLYLELKKEVFTRKSLFELADSQALQKNIILWLEKDGKMKKRKMNSVTHPRVLVSAVMRKTTDVKLDWFTNFLGDQKSEELVSDVAYYTAAAPFYFTSKNCYIDGGLLANNPSLHAVTTIQGYLRRKEQGRKISLVVSVGTGRNPPRPYYTMEINNPLVRAIEFPMFMVHVVESHSVLCEDSCHQMCVEQGIEYLRLNPALPTEIGPAETNDEKLLDMLWTTRKYMHRTSHYLDRLDQFLQGGVSVRLSDNQ